MAEERTADYVHIMEREDWGPMTQAYVARLQSDLDAMRVERDEAVTSANWLTLEREDMIQEAYTQRDRAEAAERSLEALKGTVELADEVAREFAMPGHFKPRPFIKRWLARYAALQAPEGVSE